MNIIILGSGVIGVTTAYFLARRGHAVKVIEKASSAGQATSFANGGQLSYSYTDPLASPAILPKLTGLIAGKDPAFKIRLSADPALLSWGMRFLRNCTASRTRFNTRNILRLALYSRQRLHALLDEHAIDFGYRRDGKLHVYADPEAFKNAVEAMRLKNEWGCRQEALDRTACLAKEPALKSWGGEIGGGIFSPLDESGDAYQFTSKLAEICQTVYGARFLYDTKIETLSAGNGRIVSVKTDKGSYQADVFVLSLGAYSPLLSRSIDLKLPVYPLKGYSLTVPAGVEAPTVSITDTRRKMVYCRLGERLRIAGMAELYGYDESLNPERVNELLEAAKEVFPKAGRYAEILHRWAGFRPSTPDSAPILGKTDYSNFYLNTGQGMLGWTLACGSAAVVAGVIDERPAAIDLTGLTLERFAA